MKNSSKNKWNNTLLKYKQKSLEIISLSKSIRYVGIINYHGRTLTGKIRPGIKPLFSPNSVREEFFAIASVMKLREKSTKVLGQVEFILINHKKTNILLFYKNGITYYITINSKTKLELTLIKKIKKLITQV